MPADRLSEVVVQGRVTAALVALEPLFVDDMVLSFVARHPSNPDSHMIVSAEGDKGEGVIRAVLETQRSQGVLPTALPLTDRTRDLVEALLIAERERIEDELRMPGDDAEGHQRDLAEVDELLALVRGGDRG